MGGEGKNAGYVRSQTLLSARFSSRRSSLFSYNQIGTAILRISVEVDSQLRFETSPVDALFELIYTFILRVELIAVAVETLRAGQGLHKHLPALNWSYR